MIHMQLSAAAELLGARYRPPDVALRGAGIDSRTVAQGSLFVALRGNRFDGHDFVDDARAHGVAAAMVSDSRRYRLPTLAVRDTHQALIELARGWRSRFELPVVAITGSNGKTTVKEMLASIYHELGPVLATRGNLNTEIGVPLTLLELDHDACAAVIELGANQPGEIARLTQLARPSVGLITQCAPAHLTGFGSVEGVARAKGELFEHLAPDGVAVVNADDRFATFWQGLAGARRLVRFGLESDADVTARWRATPQGSSLVLDTPHGESEFDVALRGTHNVMNALAAAAAAIAAGLPLVAIRNGLQRITPVAGRLQPKAAHEGALIIDDTYNANPVSLRAGLEVLADCHGRRWLVLGDMAELGPDESRYHRDAGTLARECGVERLYTTGILSEAASESFGDGATHCASQSDLIEMLCNELHRDTTVLIKGSRSMCMERVVQALTTEGRR